MLPQDDLEKIIHKTVENLELSKNKQINEVKNAIEGYIHCVSSYLIEEKIIRIDDVEEFTNNIISVSYEFFRIWGKYEQIKERFKDKNVFNFLNYLLEKSYGIICEKDKGDNKKKRIVKGTLIKPAEENEEVLAKEPYIDMFRLIKRMVNDYKDKIKRHPKMKFGKSRIFTYIREEDKELQTYLTAEFNEEPWDNIFHDIDTCLMGFNENNLGSFIDTADPHIHYLFLKTDPEMKNISSAVCMIKLVDVKDEKGNNYVLVEGVYDVGLGKVQHLDNICIKDKKGERKEGRDAVYEYIDNCLYEYAYLKKVGLLFNVNFGFTRHGSQGPIEYLNYRFKKDKKPQIYKIKDSKLKTYELNTEVYKPLEEGGWPDFNVVKLESPDLDKITKIRYLNSAYHATKKKVRNKQKGDNYPWGLPEGGFKVVEMSYEYIKKKYEAEHTRGTSPFLKRLIVAGSIFLMPLIFSPLYVDYFSERYSGDVGSINDNVITRFQEELKEVLLILDKSEEKKSKDDETTKKFVLECTERTKYRNKYYNEEGEECVRWEYVERVKSKQDYEKETVSKNDNNKINNDRIIKVSVWGCTKPINRTLTARNKYFNEIVDGFYCDEFGFVDKDINMSYILENYDIDKIFAVIPPTPLSVFINPHIEIYRKDGSKVIKEYTTKKETREKATQLKTYLSLYKNKGRK